nr:hypothetical protein [Akkermansiaceae bacterium]
MAACSKPPPPSRSTRPNSPCSPTPPPPIGPASSPRSSAPCWSARSIPASAKRLIRPVIIDPLRDEWEATRLAAANLHREAEAAADLADAKEDEAKQQLSIGNAVAKQTGAAAAKLRAEANKKDAEALKLVTAFHRRLCALRFLDPACGTANFLYVTLEHLKRLEAEVLELVTALGGDATFEMTEYKVRPEQFLGLELSPNAVAIAQLVLWIGYFQCQRKTTGKA